MCISIFNALFLPQSEIHILIESDKENNELDLYITYLVQNARWTPKYDIRVKSGFDNAMIVNTAKF